MIEDRVYNFAAGPSILPESVLQKAQKEILNFNGSGMSVMEMSHRGPVFQEIFNKAESSFRELMQVPETHKILFLQGGATLQFASIPMNLMKGKSADYAVTGNFSGIAATESAKYGTVHIAADTSEGGHKTIPAQSELKLSDDAEYFYYCANNTVYGTEWQYVPETSAPLVSDMSSEIFSYPVDVSRFGLIYAGAQKNIAPAGLTVVIVDKALLGNEIPSTPKVMSYKILSDNDSMLNTPPCWNIYMLSLVADWIKEQGGLEAMDALRHERSALIYDVLDNSRFYIPHAEKEARSFMNVTFRTPNEELDAKFVKEAAAKGLVSLKGHKKTGGIRASLYNAMPLEGAEKLAEFMKEFELKNE